MSVTRVQVTYRSPEIDKELDEKILEFFNTLDFICVDLAFMSIIWRRQIDFERQTGANIIEDIDTFKARKSKEIEEEKVGKHESKRDSKVKLTA